MIFADTFNTWEWFRYAPTDEVFDLQLYEEAINSWPLFFSIIAFWFGCNIGSFLNVCVYRIPLGISLISPPSHCPNCHHLIRWYENIPIFSYLCLGRKCSACKLPISPRYMLGESLTGLAFGIAFYYIVKSNLSLSTIFLYALIISVLIPAAVIDAKFRFIPNKLSYTLLILAPLYHLLHGICLPPHIFDFQMFYLSFSTACLFGGLLAVFTYMAKLFFKRDAFGLGDVKLIAGISAALGALPTTYIMLLGSISAMIIIPIYRIKYPKRRKRAFAFGPFLAISTGIWLLFGISFTNRVLYPDPNTTLAPICFVNTRNYGYEERRHNELQRRKDAIRIQKQIQKRKKNESASAQEADSAGMATDAILETIETN